MSQIEIIIDSLNDLCYSSDTASSVDNPDLLKETVDTNLIEFSKIVSYLTDKLSYLLNLEEKVNPIENLNEQATFNLEICSFLKELNCPYRSLTSGPIEERFVSSKNKLDLLDFLTSELQAAKIISINKPELKPTIIRQKSSETEEAKALKKILITLGFPKPPANVTIKEIWSKIENKCTQLITQFPKDYLGKPLLTAALSDEQWEKLMHINQILCDDFQLRRELLLTRLDVTIQSFKWADRLKKNNNEIADLYNQRRKQLSIKQNVKIYDVLAARDDLLKQEKTCSTRLMCRSQIHKIIIPKVPDRGGRTCELEAPPPEMPKFMQRKTSSNPQAQRPRDSGGRGGGRGGGNNRRFDNSNKNWNQPKSDYDKFHDTDYGSSSGGGGGGGGGYSGGGRGRGGGNRY